MLPDPWTCPRCGIERNELAVCDRCDLPLEQVLQMQKEEAEEEEDMHVYMYKDHAFSTMTVKELREMQVELLQFPTESAVLLTVHAMSQILGRLIQQEKNP